MAIHSFGNPVTCAGCGQPVGSVEAESWYDALMGKGYCEVCHGVRVANGVDGANQADTRPTGDDSQREQPSDSGHDL